MNFLLDSTILSTLHAMLLSVLMTSYVDNPIYQWPPDYLTSQPYCKLSKCEENACTASASDTLPTFDYIIAGSGPAGSTIVHRLVKQFPDRKILLIEVGQEPSIESVIPKNWVYNLNTSVTHNYFAEKSEKYSQAFKRGTDCMCGKQIGGSAGVNTMMYVCGTDQNYNNWAGLTDDESWNYDNMLPLIKKNQNMRDSRLTTGKCAAYHGTEGPLVVTSSDYDLNSNNLLPILRAATKEKGERELTEINCGPPYTGFVQVQATVNNGERSSAARNFLVPIRDYPNFYLMKDSLVEKVEMRKENGNLVVTGVSVLTQHNSCKKITLKAKREVIISAGGYNSPQILLRSGIGKENDLKECKIEQLIDLPVGHHLSDHFITIHFYTIPGTLTNTIPNAMAFFGAQGMQFVQAHSGYFTTTGFNYHWFVNTANRSSIYPDMQIILGLVDQNLLDVDVFFASKIGFKDEFVDQLVKANQKSSIIMVANVLLQPESRGSVKLRKCSDPYAPPIIDANYLDSKKDETTVLRAMEMLDDLMNSTAARNAGIEKLALKIPECDGCGCYNRCYLRYFSQNLWHPTGTCRMGVSAADNVVDSTLKVFGVKKTEDSPMLRVADASIMPLVTSSNTQCPTYAIGEKAAAMIIAENL